MSDEDRCAKVGMTGLASSAIVKVSEDVRQLRELPRGICIRTLFTCKVDLGGRPILEIGRNGFINCQRCSLCSCSSSRTTGFFFAVSVCGTTYHSMKCQVSKRVGFQPLMKVGSTTRVSEIRQASTFHGFSNPSHNCCR